MEMDIQKFKKLVKQHMSKNQDNSENRSTYRAPLLVLFDSSHLTEFLKFPCKSISVSCNFDSNTTEIQKFRQMRGVKQDKF